MHRLKEIFRRFLKRLLLILYPPKCASCGVVGYRDLCPECERALEACFEPKRFLASGGNGYADGMFTLFPYDKKVVKKMLLLWKREDFPQFSRIFAPYLQKLIRKKLLPQKIHYVAFLPRRQAARRKAGFDQAERISELLSSLTLYPLLPLLERRGYAKAQRKARYKHRERNIHGAFRTSYRLKGESVLLIDDIITTGATAREGARILKRAGAMKVYILSLAH